MNQTLPESPALQDQIQELRELARKDSLSGLLNRVTAEQCIKQRLARLKPDELCAMMELLTKWSQKICSGNLSRKKDAHRRHFMAHINRFKFKEVAERRQ